MADEIIDIFSGLDHKAGMGEDGGTGGIDWAQSWISGQNARRINFYARVRALLETKGRIFLAEDPDYPDKQADWQEYGDPAVLVARQASAVVGDGVTIGIVGADDPVPDRPDIRPAPQPPSPGLVEHEARIEERIYSEAAALWEAEAEEIIERWMEDILEREPLIRRQEWLREWAEADGLIASIFENETENVVPLGSGVYVVGWDSEKLRPTVSIYEPDVYFPVLEPGAPSLFPEKVHLAWEFVELEDGKEVVYVRRITYELVTIPIGDELELDPDKTLPPGVDPGPAPIYLEEGEIQRKVCLLSDGVWPVEAFEEIDGLAAGVKWRTVGTDAGPVELNRFPIGLDFIPVVHMPNTLATSTHFGRSAIGRLGQLFDEIAAADADESLSARWAARPPIGVSGLSPGESTIDITSGKGLRLGENGSISIIDMSKNLDALGERLLRLLKRLSVNAQVPEGLLGRVDASEVPSGLALTLSFTPFSQLIESMRMARAGKYALLLKMVQRIAIQNGDESLEGETAVFPAELRFGSFMPQDLAGIAGVLEILRRAGLVSQMTGLQMVQEAGAPIDDISAELAAIRAVDAVTADLFTAALEDPKYAARYLGVTDYGVDAGVDTEGGDVGVPGAALPGSSGVGGASGPVV